MTSDLKQDAKSLIQSHRKLHYQNLLNRMRDIDFVFGITRRTKNDRIRITYSGEQNMYIKSIDGDTVLIWKTFNTLLDN